MPNRLLLKVRAQTVRNHLLTPVTSTKARVQIRCPQTLKSARCQSVILTSLLVVSIAKAKSVKVLRAQSLRTAITPKASNGAT